MCRSVLPKRTPNSVTSAGCGKSKDNKRTLSIKEEAQEEEAEWSMFNVQAVQDGTDTRILVNPEVNGIPIEMELDTGAVVTIVSEDVWQSKLAGAPLDQTSLALKTYTGEPVELLGQLLVNVRHNGQEAHLPLQIAKGNGPALLGRNWLDVIRLDWNHIKHITLAVDQLVKKYDDLFQDGLGTMKNIQARLSIQPNATPRFYKPRSVPYALREAIERELERLEHLGVIEKVSHSDWAAPIVPVPKADKTVRICGDYKVTINPVLQVDQFPLPKPEDLFATLSGGRRFSKLDLSHAYQQIVLEPESRKFVTINTHRGLYRYNRLPFGVASAPAMFQQAMEKVLQGLPMVVCYIDDLLVTGRNEEEHLQNLEKVFQRLHDHGLWLKRTKCQFMKPSVEYLGYVIDADGLHTAPNKVAAIANAPGLQKLRSFLGLVNYYGKFVPDLATIAHPLNRLLGQKVKWHWTADCEHAFRLLKDKLTSTPVLVHYDGTLPLRLACDASSYGVGAVLSHVMADGSERPIAYASKTLSKSECLYAQIEKEALAIVFEVKRFHQYLYGHQFTLVTDHKPLLTILGPKSSLPSLAAARLQRWAILLSAYQYQVEFRPTAKHSNADGLSRLPLESECAEEQATSASLFNLSQIADLPVDSKQLRLATSRDSVLSKVLRYTLYGWPQDVNSDLQPYFHRKHELSVEAGCLFWGMRVIVPDRHRKWVLDELHSSHPGIVRMKSLARTHVWWPKIDQQIEERVRECTSCQSIRNRPSPALLHPWSWPSQPWQRIHVDFAGPLLGTYFLVVVDAHSKWLEIMPMLSRVLLITQPQTEKLKGLFRHSNEH